MYIEVEELWGFMLDIVRDNNFFHEMRIRLISFLKFSWFK
jgi:hypothetical protein